MEAGDGLLQSELQKRNIVLVKLLYSTAHCKVYEAFNQANQVSVALKLQLCSQMAYTRMLEEAQIQASFVHPAVVRLYSSFAYWVSQGHLVLVLEMDLAGKDVGKDIMDRGTNGFPYTEEDLKGVVFTLVEVLAVAQEQGIAHRDIKPANILLHREGCKLGDFGSAKRIVQTAATTVVGTPIYLSPALRVGLTQNICSVYHNPFKSDVYSLAITVLHMAHLKPPILMGQPYQLGNLVGMMQYSDWLKGLLGWMLTESEEQRPDFLQLRGYLTSQAVPELPASQPEEVAFLEVSPPALPASEPQSDPELHCTNCNIPGTAESLVLMDDGDIKGYYHLDCLQKKVNDKVAKKPSIYDYVSGALVVTGTAMMTIAMLQ